MSFLRPSKTWVGKAKTTVLAGLAVVASMVCRVLREMAPDLAICSIAFLRFSEAESSP